MAKRSLQASPKGIEQAKRAFTRKGWTQDNLAAEVNLKTRQPIWRFFSGQRIERYTFIEVCVVLELDWREIAIDPPAEFLEFGEVAQAAVVDIDNLVKEVRSQRFEKIKNQCGILQFLDVSHPVSIDDIYIDINISEEITSFQWLEFADLQSFTSKELDRFSLGEVSQTQITGIKAVQTYSKLRVLGKAGVGKTTFLQHLGIQCQRGIFAANRVPIFVTLRDFADEERESQEFDLLNYIRKEFLICGISDPSVLETLLLEGRVLLLLDGLDEVYHQETKAIINEIRRLSEKYHNNMFVVTCRTAAQVFNLTRFTDVEIAPFSQNQIVAFAQKWFTALTKTNVHQEQAIQFIEKLDLPENVQFRRLAVVPLFLHLTCWVFRHNNEFPTQKAAFYKQCLDLLLYKWDESKAIERDEVYQGFFLPQKLKLLTQLASETFEQGNYFFEQRLVEQYIGDYLRDLPNASTESDELQLDSERILKAIELQHGLLTERSRGIFSFSYLTFQEYLTARKIVASYDLQGLEEPLEGLVSHLTEPRWREIFLLTVPMLRNADLLVQLMKQRIDALVAQEPSLQKCLTCASQNFLPTPSPLKEMISKHQNIQHHWHFSPEQQQLLQQYYYANQLLIDCLNSNCQVTEVVRQKIEDSLLLPTEQLCLGYCSSVKNICRLA
ncbi:MAG: NACHT domain-containing NTPase [Nostoc sp.]|uniref:NACHT domain-containing protein n=1 Tax=Nostoc sp. TaxID=1180 RepID=UPI002FF8460A